jgi:alpha-L-arabinofuranosidase
MRAIASVDVDLAARPEPYSRDLFGHFIEHFHRQVYGGLFEPGSELSDERGFRLDVVEAMRELRAPVVRWPGGCFVSSYHWLDGVGPSRRSHYDKAWRVTDPNTFGTREFVEWCAAIGAEPSSARTRARVPPRR